MPTTATAGTAANVTTGKHRVDGGIFVAPASTALPTDASTALADAFKLVGFISEDGISKTESKTVGEIKEWNGAVVDTTVTDFKVEWKIKFIEALNVDTLKLIYGAENVMEVTNDNRKITVKVNGSDPDEHVVVINLAVKGGKQRIVIPRGKIKELGQIVYNAKDPVAYDATLSALADALGNCEYEYTELDAAS